MTIFGIFFSESEFLDFHFNTFSLFNVVRHQNSINVLKKNIFFGIRNYCSDKRFYTKTEKFHEILSAFLHAPIFKLWSKSIIIGSLLLIITKLLFGEYLSFWTRISLLIIYTGISMWLNLRERIKRPVKAILRKCLGPQFFLFHAADLEKKDYYSQTKIENNTLLYTTVFEIKWFFQYLFQRFYIFISYIRFYFDNHPVIYFVFYYSIFVGVVLLNKAIILSYIGLFFICTRLLIYIGENNWGEIKIKMTEQGYNEKLLTTKLKITRRNVMIYVFWNLRNIQLDSEEFYSYILSEGYIWNMNNLYDFSPYFSLSSEGLPLEYNEETVIIKSMFHLFPVYQTSKNTISNEITHGKQIVAKTPLGMYPNLKPIIELLNGHDGRLVLQQYYDLQKSKFQLSATTFTSSKGSLYLTPLGAINVQPHSNKKNGDMTCEVGLFYIEGDTFEDLQEKISRIFKSYVVDPSKFIQKSFEQKEIKNSLNITPLIDHLPPNFIIKDLIDQSLLGILITKGCRNFNPHNYTFGQYINEIIKGNYTLADEIINGINEVLKNSYYYIRSVKAQEFSKKNGGKMPSENVLDNERDVRKSRESISLCEKVIKKQEIIVSDIIQEGIALLQKRELIEDYLYRSNDNSKFIMPEDDKDTLYVKFEQMKKQFIITGNPAEIEKYNSNRIVKINMHGRVFPTKKSYLEKYYKMSPNDEQNKFPIENHKNLLITSHKSNLNIPIPPPQPYVKEKEKSKETQALTKPKLQEQVQKGLKRIGKDLDSLD